MQNSKLQLKIQKFSKDEFKKLYTPPHNSHKGQNGKLMIIAGSKLFHAPLLWTLKVASRIVDMVFCSSTFFNNEIVKSLKREFRDGIVVPRNRLDDYMNEADCILIGPGLPRNEGKEEGDDDTKELTERLVKKYSYKKWIIDGGSLQVIDPAFIPSNAILTPHKKEFLTLFKLKTAVQMSKLNQETVQDMAKKYGCTILLKGREDIVCDRDKCVKVVGGNAGMTKGGTGDVLAGLVAALYCKNDAFLSACAGSFINKKAGDSLFTKVAYYFNASDLADEIPKVMKEFVG